MKASNNREKRTDLVSRKDRSLFVVERPRSMADAVDHDHDHQPHSGWFIPRLNTAEPGGKKKKKKRKRRKGKEEKGEVLADWAQRVGKLCHFGPFFLLSGQCRRCTLEGLAIRDWNNLFLAASAATFAKAKYLSGRFASERGKSFGRNGEVGHWKFIVEQANECINRR